MAHKRVLLLSVAALAVGGVSVAVAQASTSGRSHRGGDDHSGGSRSGSHTATPIKHVVVIFQENVSFDHYFGTYPNAANTDGQTVPRRARHAGGRRSPAGHEPLRCRRAFATARTC